MPIHHLRLLEDSSEDTSKCEMFGSFGYIVQAILGLFAFLILVVKRFIEKPRRPWKIWWFDASKQIISAGVVHWLNLLLSSILSNDSDECWWYFVSIFMDCTLGIFITYILMWLIDGLSKASNWKFLQSGWYFEEYVKNSKKRYRLKPKMYFSQLGVWLSVTVIAKLLMLWIWHICKRFLENFGKFIWSPFDNGKVKLVMVMVIFPLILNAVYFWISDNIIKFNPDENDKDLKSFYLEEDGGEKAKGTDADLNGVEKERINNNPFKGNGVNDVAKLNNGNHMNGNGGVFNEKQEIEFQGLD